MSAATDSPPRKTAKKATKKTPQPAADDEQTSKSDIAAINGPLKSAEDQNHDPKNPKNVEQIYKTAETYWNSVSPDVDGMLGGFSALSDDEVKESHKFLRHIEKKLGTKMGRALDCGAGIGRVTKHTLLPIFDTVDMVDVIASFIDKSADYLGTELNSRVERKITCGLQTLEPEPDRYDVIWIQWVSGHLTDDDFVKFFRRCKAALRPNGCVVLKENICSLEKPHFDDEDNSWTRPHKLILKLFKEAGCEVKVDQLQSNWPKYLYKVRTFALQ